MNGNFNNNYYGNSGYVPQNTNMQQAMYPQQTMYPQQAVYPQQAAYPQQTVHPQQAVYPQQAACTQQDVPTKQKISRWFMGKRRVAGIIALALVLSVALICMFKGKGISSPESAAISYVTAIYAGEEVKDLKVTDSEINDSDEATVTLTFRAKKGEDGKWKKYKSRFECYQEDGVWYAFPKSSER